MVWESRNRLQFNKIWWEQTWIQQGFSLDSKSKFFLVGVHMGRIHGALPLRECRTFFWRHETTNSKATLLVECFFIRTISLSLRKWIKLGWPFFTSLFLLVDTQQQWAMKVTLGPLQSHVMSCNLILVNCYGDARGFGIQRWFVGMFFYPTQDAEHLFVEDSRKPEVTPSFATIASWESQVIIAIYPPQGLTVTIIYLQPQPPLQKGTTTLDHFTTSRDSGLGGAGLICLTVGKRFWSTKKNGGPDLDDHFSSSFKQLEILGSRFGRWLGGGFKYIYIFI